MLATTDGLSEFDQAFAHRFHDRPGYGRWPCFRAIVAHLLHKQRPVRIVETGTARQKDNWAGDGQSTLIWDWVVGHTGGSGVSIDCDAEACEIARSQVKHMQVVNADSLMFLRQMILTPIDLLYLDSYDYESGNAASLHHAGELACVWDSLPAGCIVAVDDCIAPHRGKHVLVKWFMESTARAPFVDGYISAWVK